jgi:Domain of unknown function (DUF397)
VSDWDPVALSWRKSSASASGDCVEVAALVGYVVLRDSKGKRSHTLSFRSSEWENFLSCARSGKFDVDILNHAVASGEAGN